MDMELAQDLDIALSVITNGDPSFRVLDGEHKTAKCILRSDIHAYLMQHVSVANRDTDYIDHLLYLLYRHQYICRSVHDDHFQPHAPGRLFLKKGGYEGRVRDLEAESARREAERVAEHNANVSAVESASRANRQATYANRWALVSAASAVLTVILTFGPSALRSIYEWSSERKSDTGAETPRAADHRNSVHTTESSISHPLPTSREDAIGEPALRSDTASISPNEN
jgi:hypothetical protein